MLIDSFTFTDFHFHIENCRNGLDPTPTQGGLDGVSITANSNSTRQASCTVDEDNAWTRGSDMEAVSVM